MYKNHSEMDLEIREKMREGNGQVQLLHILKSNELRGKCRLFSQITLEPGCSIGSHAHDQEEEIFYILSGSGIVDDDGMLRDVSPGDVLSTGAGETHSIMNNGTEPLVFIAVILLFD